MFDNNMNNNGNFNNGTPLFSNNQNNIDMNNGYQNGTSGFDNSPNGSFVQPWQQNNNIQNSVGQSHDAYNSILTSEYNSAMSVSSDIPPDLGEIKNLSDASVASAPTMDVLAPMNVMPESLPQKQDPLDAYESGNLNLSGDVSNIGMNINNNFLQQNYNTQNPIPTYSNNQSNLNTFNPNSNLINNTYPNVNTNVVMPMQNQFSSQATTPVTPVENQNTYQTNPISNSTNFGYNPMGMQNFNNTEANDSLTNSLPSLDNDSNLSINKSGSNEMDYSVTSAISKEVTDKEIYNNSEYTEHDSTTPSSSVSITEKPKEEIEETKEIEDSNVIIDNDELQKTELKDNETDKTKLEDLGIETDFSEPDTLEIMDIDSDITQEDDIQDNSLSNIDKEDISKDESTGLVSKNVDKIKSLIDELKSDGANIELEEFDFESTYQIIVKISK